MGFRVVESSNGEEALREIEVSRFDVVVLDVNMPGIGESKHAGESGERLPGFKF